MKDKTLYEINKVLLDNNLPKLSQWKREVHENGVEYMLISGTSIMTIFIDDGKFHHMYIVYNRPSYGNGFYGDTISDAIFKWNNYCDQLIANIEAMRNFKGFTL